MVAIPPYFLANMDGLSVKEVVLSAPDKDHIVIELVRSEKNEQ